MFSVSLYEILQLHVYIFPDRFRFLHPAELFIERFCMTGGNSPIGYLKAYHTNLYLSADPVKVREALEEGERAAYGREW